MSCCIPRHLHIVTLSRKYFARCILFSVWFEHCLAQDYLSPELFEFRLGIEVESWKVVLGDEPVLGVYKSALWSTIGRDGHFWHSAVAQSKRNFYCVNTKAKVYCRVHFLIALKGESVRLASNSNESNSGCEIQRRFKYRTYTWNQRFVLTRRSEPEWNPKISHPGTQQTSRHIQFGLGPKPCLVRNDYFFCEESYLHAWRIKWSLFTKSFHR